MKDNKSPGVDVIPPKLLKEIVEQISTSLAKVLTCHSKKEWFLQNRKSKHDAAVVCKLLETLIRDHMVEFLVKHKLINASQDRFLKTKACLTNLLCFGEEITKWVDNGSPVDVVYLDFLKVLDIVPHQNFLLKPKPLV